MHGKVVKNKGVTGIGGGQITIAQSIAKGVILGSTKYPSIFFSNPCDVPHNVLKKHIQLQSIQLSILEGTKTCIPRNA